MLNRSQSGIASETRSSAYRRSRKAVSIAVRNRWAKIIVIALSLAPVVVLILQAGDRSRETQAGTLLARQTGDWALVFLILTLAITPLRRILDLPDLIRFRRTLGLFAFLYACLHVAAWRVFKLGHGLQIGSLTIWSFRIGFFGFALMIPLAVTSTDHWVRWLGGKRWRALHSLAYLSAISGIVHYWLLPDIAIWNAIAYSATIALLLMLRIGTPIMRA